MLVRQRMILVLLREARSLSPTMLVKLAFLLRHETELGEEAGFYDFVPYRYGPVSFTLYRDLDHLQVSGLVERVRNYRIAARRRLADEAERHIAQLPPAALEAVKIVVRKYRKMTQSELVDDVYARYPWYASRSELRHGRGKKPRISRKAVLTVGYEGKSVDAFFDGLLREGVEVLVDVRANPVSRKYGFSKKSLSAIAEKLGMAYRHLPHLGIPSSARVHLSDDASYRRLLKRYETRMLPRLEQEVEEVATLMKRHLSALMCVEEDVQCCHRSRLADAVACTSGLKVRHLP